MTDRGRGGVDAALMADLDPEIENPATRGTSAAGPLASQVRRGAAWSVGGQVGGQLLQLGSTAVLARLLSPTDYGLAGLVAVVVGLAAIFVDFGIPTAIIRAPRLTERYLATAFYLNLGFGVVMAGLVCALAVPLARFFDEPQMTGLVLLSSIVFLLQFNSIHASLMQRGMQFPRLTRMGLANSFTSTVVTIVAALLGLGAASIILGNIAQRLVSIVQMQMAVRWWPRPMFSGAAARSLWAFGRGVIGSNLVGYAAGSADRVLIGRTLDVAAVGYWGRATNLLTLPMRQSVGVLGKVFFSALSKMTGDIPRLRSSWLTLLRATWLIGLPVAGGMAASAPAFVGTIYGDQWDQVVPLLIITSAAIPFWLIGAISRPVYEAMGRTSLHFALTSVDSVIYIALLIGGLQFGLTGVAVATLIRAPIAAGLMLVPLMRMIQMKPSQLLSTAWRSVLVTVIMVAVVVFVGSATHDLAIPLQLVTQVATGAFVYSAGIWLLERQTVRYILGRDRRRTRPISGPRAAGSPSPP